MTRATTHDEAYAARWPGNSRAEFDAKRELVRQDMLAEVSKILAEIRAARLQQEARTHG